MFYVCVPYIMLDLPLEKWFSTGISWYIAAMCEILRCTALKNFNISHFQLKYFTNLNYITYFIGRLRAINTWRILEKSHENNYTFIGKDNTSKEN